MKKYIVGLVCITAMLFSYQSTAQDSIVYYDAGGYKVSSKDSANYYKTYKKLEGGLFRVERRRAEDDELLGEGICLSKDSASLHGHYTDRYNGRVTSEGNYQYNKRVGTWTHYLDSGTVWYIDNYRNDTLVDTLTSYYKNGSIKRKQYYEHGIVKGGYCWDEHGKERKFTQFETLPYPEYNVMSYLSANVHYPGKARRQGKQGRVLVGFVVNENGSISDVEVVRGVCPEIDDEALRVVKDMANWKPGLQDDKPVKVRYTQPITFKLE